MSEGVVIDRECTDVLPPGTRLRPLRDQIVVKPLAWEPSKTIQIAGDTRKPLRGTVVAVGPGTYPWKYKTEVVLTKDGVRRDRTERRESKVFRKTQVKVGDIVELGGLEIGGYRFQQVVMDNAVHVICREEDVTGICST